ncbi:MAG: phosphopantetheine-binding protein [Firmicutes bacterium]|nr:phosphopantetheine-binding protein [Bacillota bacterium]
MEELLELLNELHPDVDFSSREHLIDEGVLDSMDIVSLISMIRESFDVSITAKDIVPDNFNSASAIYALIKRLEDEDD